MLSWSKSVEKEATVKHSTASKNPTGRGKSWLQNAEDKGLAGSSGQNPDWVYTSAPHQQGTTFTLGTKYTMCGALLSLWNSSESKHWPAEEEGLRIPIPRADCNPTAGVIYRTLPARSHSSGVKALGWRWMFRLKSVLMPHRASINPKGSVVCY